METLKAAREEDFWEAGLKMGDIIKLRRVLAMDEVHANSSLSSCSGSEPESSDTCTCITTPNTCSNSPNPTTKQVGSFPVCNDEFSRLHQ